MSWVKRWRHRSCWRRRSNSRVSCRCNCRERDRCTSCWRNAPAASACGGWPATVTRRIRPSPPQRPSAILIGPGNLTVTLETDDGAQRYQGIVPINGDRLADSLQGYFENSEQMPTRLWLHADGNGVSGMLLQRLPDNSGEAASAAVDDAWRRLQLIGDTLTPEELRTLADAEILHRLFNEDDLRLFEPSPVYFRCRCSRERVAGMLQGSGRGGDEFGSGGSGGGRGAL